MTTIDELMNRDPLDLSTQDIQEIIAYHRRNRANFQSGGKAKKELGPSLKIDREALGLTKTEPAQLGFKRRSV